jgi:hypothetical protein
MNREDIIRLAKEAGFSTFLDRSNPMWGSMVASHEEIERFAELVAKAEREASFLRGYAAAVSARGEGT